jgi:hypothetical protein
MKKTLETLEKGDYIAFGFNYHGGKPNEIIVDKITLVEEDRVFVHFLYNYKSLCEVVKKEDILAIGNRDGDGKIPGWRWIFQMNELNPKKIEEIVKRK